MLGKILHSKFAINGHKLAMLVSKETLLAMTSVFSPILTNTDTIETLIVLCCVMHLEDNEKITQYLMCITANKLKFMHTGLKNSSSGWMMHVWLRLCSHSAWWLIFKAMTERSGVLGFLFVRARVCVYVCFAGNRGRSAGTPADDWQTLALSDDAHCLPWGAWPHQSYDE